ncbi:MAG: hypothetical protein ACK4N5_09720 [Myxococcales bacterium]
MAMLGSACLPFDLGPVEEPPPPVNVHPRIEESSVRPQGARIDLSKEIGCRIKLAVGVVNDADVDDVLSARWFIDFDYNPGASNPIYHQHELENRGRPERVGSEFEFVGLNYPPGLHTVEVVFSDGFAGSGGPRKVQDGKGSDVYRWFIDSTLVTKDRCAETVQ